MGKVIMSFPQLAAVFRDNPDVFYDIDVKTVHDELIPLSTLMTIKGCHFQ